MAKSVIVEREDHATIGRYIAKSSSGEDLAVSYTRPRKDLIYINHISGKGIRAVDRVLTQIVKDARDAGARIVPVDQKASKVFAKHPDWADVLQAA